MAYFFKNSCTQPVTDGSWWCCSALMCLSLSVTLSGKAELFQFIDELCEQAELEARQFPAGRSGF